MFRKGKMTPREKQILEMIRENPVVSQNELARRLDITRASVGVHISNLTKKGYLLGKGYIVSESHPITVIGGANMDIHAMPKSSMVMHDSNPGNISMALGGVARNISENLALLGMDVRLVSAVGEDAFGERIIRNALVRNINIKDIIQSKTGSTSIYSYVNDLDGDLLVAVSDMEILNNLDVNFFKNRLPKIDNSKITVIEANLPQDSISYLCKNLRKTKIVADTVSTTKARKLIPVLANIYLLKPNLLEAEVILGHQIKTKTEIIEAGDEFLERGVEKIIITLGKDGIYYADEVHSYFLKPRVDKVVNTNGSGDAFLASLVFALHEGYDTKRMLDFALSGAALTSMSEETINPEISLERVEEMERRTQVV
ncbi:winged helix-turn-helix transcriptional regulator [Clostridia bacterium]|nr:winged helix-turn-helix transcriptional regulator [Clostridia bacterium]